MLNISCLMKLINGKIESEYLISKLYINIPQRPTRYYNFLMLKYFSVNYANFDPFRRICNEFNKLYNLIDFNLNINYVKRNIILYLNCNNRSLNV